MRIAAILGVALPLAVAVAGCGKIGRGDAPVITTRTGAPAASGSAGPSALQTFAECLRQHGMPWFPDAVAPGREQDIALPSGVTREAFEAAQLACLPSGSSLVTSPTPNAEDVARLRRMTACMRENGVPGYPDPGADGSLMLDAGELGVKTDSPVFKAAEKACGRLGDSSR